MQHTFEKSLELDLAAEMVVDHSNLLAQPLLDKEPESSLLLNQSQK